MQYLFLSEYQIALYPQHSSVNPQSFLTQMSDDILTTNSTVEDIAEVKAQRKYDSATQKGQPFGMLLRPCLPQLNLLFKYRATLASKRL